MSIKMQKIIRFIPIINMITMFCWIKACSIYSIKPSWFLKELLKMFLGFIIITVIRIFITYTWQNDFIDGIATIIAGYFYFLVMALVSVRAQEKILKNEDN